MTLWLDGQGPLSRLLRGLSKDTDKKPQGRTRYLKETVGGSKDQMEYGKVILAVRLPTQTLGVSISATRIWAAYRARRGGW